MGRIGKRMKTRGGEDGLGRDRREKERTGEAESRKDRTRKRLVKETGYEEGGTQVAERKTMI